MRISLSGLTTEEEINEFLKAFDECYKKLNIRWFNEIGKNKCHMVY